MRGIQVARLNLGRGAVVCGAGPIGLIALAAARTSGAHPIVITDVEPRRLAFAKEFVPSCITYQVDPAEDAEGNAKAIRALFGESEYAAPETVLECTGVESSVCTAAYTARRGGVVVVIGVGKPIMNNLPFMHMSLAEVSLLWALVELLLTMARLICGSSIDIGTLGHRPLRVSVVGFWT
jgi:threonine dehydrogenase-like Zn-dependent dehydrogenase